MSTTAALALVAGLSALPSLQDEAALQAGIAEALGERREEIRVIVSGAPDGPGRLDADGDGILTREEFSAPMSRAFDRLDADRDGRLTTEERAAGHGGDDRVIMMHGPHGGPGPLILPRGAGGDGGEVFVFRHGAPGMQGGPRHAGPGGPRIEIRRFGGPEGHREMDADNDGRVSEAEFLAPLREAFQRMDADRDGALDQGEAQRPPPPSDD